jgi:uncharacterized protein YjiS (DUF1127 family)
MSTTIAKASNRAVPLFPNGRALKQRDDSGSPAVGWLETVRLWIERSRQRRILRDRGELNDALLKDIGVSQGEALREGAKRFWQQ